MRLIIRIILLCAVIVLLLLVRLSPLSTHFTLESVQASHAMLTEFVHDHYISSVFIFILLYAIIISFSLPLGAVFTLTSGFLYGTIPGTLYSNIGATAGATGAFFLIRYFVGAGIQRKYKEQLKDFNYYMHHYGWFFLLVIHFVAVIPFFLINILAALTNVPLWTFVWTTSLGIIPGSLVYAFAGEQLNTIDSLSDIFSWTVILAFILLAVLLLLPLLIKYIWGEPLEEHHEK